MLDPSEGPPTVVVGATTPPPRDMQLPASTGQVATYLGSNEPRLNELVRRGQVQPKPPILAGRRLWGAEHVLQAAAALDVLTDELLELVQRAGQKHRADEQIASVRTPRSSGGSA